MAGGNARSKMASHGKTFLGILVLLFLAFYSSRNWIGSLFISAPKEIVDDVRHQSNYAKAATHLRGNDATLPSYSALSEKKVSYENITSSGAAGHDHASSLPPNNDGHQNKISHDQKNATKVPSKSETLQSSANISANNSSDQSSSTPNNATLATGPEGGSSHKNATSSAATASHDHDHNKTLPSITGSDKDGHQHNKTLSATASHGQNATKVSSKSENLPSSTSTSAHNASVPSASKHNNETLSPSISNVTKGGSVPKNATKNAPAAHNHNGTDTNLTSKSQNNSGGPSLPHNATLPPSTTSKASKGDSGHKNATETTPAAASHGDIAITHKNVTSKSENENGNNNATSPSATDSSSGKSSHHHNATSSAAAAAAANSQDHVAVTNKNLTSKSENDNSGSIQLIKNASAASE